MWNHLAINNYGIEQQLLKACVRTVRCGKMYAQARNATYMMIRYEDGGATVAGFGRVNYLYDGTGDHYTATHMLVSLDIIKTAAVNMAQILVEDPLLEARKDAAVEGMEGAVVRHIRWTRRGCQ